MRSRKVVALLLGVMVAGAALIGAGPIPPPPPGPPPAAPPGPSHTAPPSQTPGPRTAATPPRLSYLTGSVSFWRPGAQDWTPATLNTPLAPGDALYTGQGGNLEIQVGPRAFIRAAEGTQIGLDNQEADFIQVRVTSGHVAVDLRELPPGSTVELDTPGAAFTMDRPGYYHVDIGQDTTTFSVRRAGHATVTSMAGTPTPLAANQQAVITGADASGLEVRAAPPLDAWNQWSSARTDQLLQAQSTRYVPGAVYGTDALDHHGTWQAVDPYGPLWVPAGVPAGWVPYSTGRWIWDPRFGWTWLDDAPWGWAPYHYGRWVFARNSWAWAPGPIVARPVYAPALVVFLGGVSVGRPLCWAPLGWGEPIIPWWGRRGFVGVATWAGWGGPRVVNNVVVSRTTVVNVQNITVYRNVNVTNAVVGVPADHFGRGEVRPTRFGSAEVRQFVPVRGALDVKPVTASVMPATGPAAKPPATLHARAVVATRAPHDPAPGLRASGLPDTPGVAPVRPSHVVPGPRRQVGPSGAAVPGSGPGSGERDPGRPRRGAEGERPADVPSSRDARSIQRPAGSRMEPRGMDRPGMERQAPGNSDRPPGVPSSRDAIPERRDDPRSIQRPGPRTEQPAPREGGREERRVAPPTRPSRPPAEPAQPGGPPAQVTPRREGRATPAPPRSHEPQRPVEPRTPGLERSPEGSRADGAVRHPVAAAPRERGPRPAISVTPGARPTPDRRDDRRRDDRP